jgi:hypothetical protein
LSCICDCELQHTVLTVLDTKSQNIPEVVVVRRREAGTGNLGGAGQLGEGGEQTGSVYKQPEREVDSSCHNWREPSKWKRVTKGRQRGDKGELERGARGVAPCVL